MLPRELQKNELRRRAQDMKALNDEVVIGRVTSDGQDFLASCENHGRCA
jgi:hypothetical protein